MEKTLINGHPNWEVDYESPPADWKKTSYGDLYRKMCDTDYMIHLNTFPSAGQFFAESAILGVLSFGFYKKMNVRILYDPFFWETSLEKVIRKIEILENNRFLKEYYRRKVRQKVKEFMSFDFHNATLKTKEDSIKNVFRQIELQKNKIGMEKYELISVKTAQYT